MKKRENIVVQDYVIYIKDGTYHLIDTEAIKISYASSPYFDGAGFEVNNEGYLVLEVDDGYKLEEFIKGFYVYSTSNIEEAALVFASIKNKGEQINESRNS